MRKFQLILFFILLPGCGFLAAQDSIKVKKQQRGDDYCWLLIVVKGQHFPDTIPRKVVMSDNKMELQVNDDCPTKKRADVFVVSFEVEDEDAVAQEFCQAQSSFFTDQQKKLILSIKPGRSFLIKNIVIHAPDGFRKMDNFKVTLTN